MGTLNLLELVNDWLVFVVLIASAAVAYVFRHRVLFVITGDDRVHADVHSAIWSALTCCRLCTGEWTRHVSACLCFWHKGLRGRNLKRAFGQMLGLVPVPIRFSNIVVGDLPAALTGDFYVAIEVGECPVQITSVVEDANPKVVQFEETLIVRVRHSPAEFSIRISVRQLNTFGSKELCECYISPMAVARWAWRQRGPMRFKMEPLNRTLQLSFPPWILVEIISQPEYGTARPFEAPAVFDVQLTELTTRMTSHFRSPASFKHHYSLLSTHGAKIDEPDEDVVGELENARRRQAACSQNLCFVFWLVSAGFLAARYYAFACTYEFEKVAMLENFVHGDFPVPDITREHLLLKCEMIDSTFFRLITDFSQHTYEGSSHYHDVLYNKTGIRVPDSVSSTIANMTHHSLHHGAHLVDAADDWRKRVANVTSEDAMDSVKHVTNATNHVLSQAGDFSGHVEHVLNATNHALSQAGDVSGHVEHVMNATNHVVSQAGGFSGHVEHVMNATNHVVSQAGELSGHMTNATKDALHHVAHVRQGVADAIGRFADRQDRRLEAPQQMDTQMRGNNDTHEELDQFQELRRCSPSTEEILDTCHELPFGERLPILQFPVFGLFSVPVPCMHGRSFCKVALHLEKYDFPYACFLAGWALVFCASRTYMKHRIEVLSDRM